MEPVTNEGYALEPVDDLDPARVSEIRRIYEDGFAPHLRADFASLTTGREDDESALALMQGSEPRGFVMVRPLGGTGWMFLRYLVAGQRGQGLGGIMWDQLMAWLREAGYPLLVLRRPGWTARPDDDWRRVPSLAAAAADLPGQRVFLTVGRTEVSAFAADEQRWFLIRSVETPDPPLPPQLQVVTARGPFEVADETALMRRHAVEVLVTRDSGGTLTSAKLTAARRLGLPVVMVDRPPAPDAPTVATVAGAWSWLTRWPLEHR